MTTTTPITQEALILDLARKCVDRMNMQGIKGPKSRHRAALEFFCGAAMALDASGADYNLTGMAFVVSVRGADELDRILAEADIAAKLAPSGLAPAIERP